MSKNTNLSFLTDYITADITNGRIGINNASPTVAFDVVGATKITGALTLTSTISNGTYAYTLPSATGTLALTSALSSYLQLTGGTLTGALSGTSGTFSSTVTAGGNLGSSSDYTALTVRNQANGDYYVGIDFASGTDSGTSSIRSYRTNSAVNYETALTFWTKSTGANPTIPTEKMRITSAGNVGIGTSSPSSSINSSVSKVLSISNTSQYAALVIQGRNGGEAGITIADDLYIDIAGNATGTNNNIVFRTTSTNSSYTATERMRITSAGDLVVGGTTSPLSEAGRGCISINGSSNSILTYTVGGTIQGYLYHGGSNGNMYLNNSKNNATTYIVSYTGGVYLATNATSWTATSDIRLKNIISPIDSAVDKLSTLNPVVFSWKSDETNKENIGLIAQDVKAVLPQVIDTNKDGFLGVRYVELVPVLVKAIQELKAEIEILKQK